MHNLSDGAAMENTTDAGEAAYEKTIISPTPLNPSVAAELLKEVKRIFDEQAIVFWLGSGTCLGSIREGRFIPWDDEMDPASGIGMNGLDEGTIYRVAEVFKTQGFYPRISSNPQYIHVGLIKRGVRIDWTCHRIVDGAAIEFPGIQLPLHIFLKPKVIEFIGEKFLVPNPPEEYLRLKYGPEWQTPKGPGFESDVVLQIRKNANLSRWRRFERGLTLGIFPRPTNSVEILDRDGHLINGAEVMIAGLGSSRTNKNGIARFFVPNIATYAMVIRYEEHEEVLYEESLVPHTDYIYRPGPKVTPEEHYKAGVRARALSLK